MDPPDENKSVSYRLTNLSQTDILLHLPLPTIPANVRADSSSNTFLDQEEICKDSVLMSQLENMLQAADVSTM